MKLAVAGDSRGFTLMEILFAMTIFTSAVLLMTTIFIALNRSFSQGTARKELSEASQVLAEDISRVIRMQGANNPIETCGTLPAGFDSSLRIGSISYAWRTASDSQARGVWKGNAQCSNLEFRLVDDRFTLRELRVTPIEDANLDDISLYRIQGVMTSGNDSGLIFPEGSWINDTNSGCRPRSSSNRNCSIERFNFILNGRKQ